jgi:ATP-dependent protease HslVU (ClpYQ) peptidase subunit
MTLALAWRSDGRIHLASDSRIKLSEKQYPDTGIKVISIPVVISGTELDQDGNLLLLFKNRYGFCYAGSLVNASTLRELLEEVLQSVQFVGNTNDLSFEIICNAVSKYCGKISTELCKFLFEKGRYEFFFTGFCPKEQCLKAAHFVLLHQNGQATASYNRILVYDGSFVAIGSGATVANSMLHNVCLNGMLLTLNEIIDNQLVESVAGDIQYGTFSKGGDFKISGLRRISMETALINDVQYGPDILNRYKYRGFQFLDNLNLDENPLWFAPTFFELEVPSNSESHEAYVNSLIL